MAGGAPHTLYHDETRPTLRWQRRGASASRRRPAVGCALPWRGVSSDDEHWLGWDARQPAGWRTREKVTDMAYWQQRGAKRYLTQSRKRHGRVIREYLGTGPIAEAMY